MIPLRKSHVLIIGTPRSGTTLFCSMLGCHPEIALLSEDLNCGEFKLVSKKVVGNKLCIPNQIELQQSYFRSSFDHVYGELQKYLNKLRLKFGQKTPIPRSRKARLSIKDYQQNSDIDLVVFGVVRSPFQGIVSILNRGSQSEDIACYRWKRGIEILYTLISSNNNNEQVHIVYYDNLVKNPQITMVKCLDFLHCEFSDEVLKGYLHTPQYQGNKTIDRNKISQGLEKDLTHAIFKQYPEIKDKYISLIKQAL
ncbi:MAG: sulfotransferase [Colwellia sp.]|nr:sulfotransferase [Colwellia sp.]